MNSTNSITHFSMNDNKIYIHPYKDDKLCENCKTICQHRTTSCFNECILSHVTEHIYEQCIDEICKYLYNSDLSIIAYWYTTMWRIIDGVWKLSLKHTKYIIKYMHENGYITKFSFDYTDYYAFAIMTPQCDPILCESGFSYAIKSMLKVSKENDTVADYEKNMLDLLLMNNIVYDYRIL